ncbi:phosphatidylinositol-specific phospholipase C1-like protein [Gammaproteobacteria bacterium]|nr:phosphatidylinositol-specific phospholipase C1-like protein [Gammaproteobacteria bacterium]
MSIFTRSGPLLLTCCALLTSTSCAAQQAIDCDTVLEGPCAIDSAALSMNDMQSVGSHNSYKLAIPAIEMALIKAYNKDSAVSLDYSHLRVTTQLDMGLRQIELDIVYDPDGGRFANPLLPKATAKTYGAMPYDARDMHTPGFKVLHSQDIDVHSNCATWLICLEEIKVWSDTNPDHVPILIMFNAKEGGSAYPGVTPALDFTREAYRALDDETLSVFPADRIIKPDDVREEFDTLREAVLAGNWPALDNARGKVLFALDERPEKVRTYMDGRSSLQGLPFFVNSISQQEDHAAYFTMNNPLGDQERIRDAVNAGFIVRTRADANTREARVNDTSRREAAFASGAQYVSTDYYVPRVEFSDYTVSLPGGAAARCNPVRLDSRCR